MRWSMFREIGYGAIFFLSAMVGMFAGLVLLVPPIRSGPVDYQIWDEVRAAIIGASGGGIAWLWIRYSFLRMPKDGGN